MNKAQTDASRFAIYSRKSKFTGKGESIDNQIEMCRQYIATTYSNEDAENALVYEDEGFSGGTLDRPQFKKMMEDSKKTPFRGIVVYRLDRISRNVCDFSSLITDLTSQGIDFISINCDYIFFFIDQKTGIENTSSVHHHFAGTEHFLYVFSGTKPLMG